MMGRLTTPFEPGGAKMLPRVTLKSTPVKIFSSVPADKSIRQCRGLTRGFDS